MKAQTDYNKLAQTRNRYKLFPSEELQIIAQVEAKLLLRARKYLEKRGFTEVVVPHVVHATGSCEIIESLFTVDYFGEDIFLTQTAQLYLESLVPFLGNVYTLGPSFRAEQRVDDRHLTEFSLLELEFEGDFGLLLNHISNLFMAMMKEVLKLPIDGVKHLNNLSLPFKRLTYTEAIEKLGMKWGGDIHSSDEAKLVEMNDNQPLFITHFPKKLKYFNMRENDANPEVVNSADFIVPFGGECVGAAEREHRAPILHKRLLDSPMYYHLLKYGGRFDDFKWYIDANYQYDYKLHSGFGMGLNRVTQFVLQLPDIRQTTIFPVNKESIY